MYELLAHVWATLTTVAKSITSLSTILPTIEKRLSAMDSTLAAMTTTLADIQSMTTAVLAAVSPLPAARLLFTFRLEGEWPAPESTIIEGTYMKITVTQKFAAAIQPVDKFDNPASLDGKPVWEASNPSILSIVPAHDGLSADIRALGPIGSSQVSVTADADLGAGVKTLVDTFTVDVVAGMAVGLGVLVGEAVEQDTPTEAVTTPDPTPTE